MTSIASATSFSPLQRLQDELASQVSAGTISTGDQAALSTALNDIDSAMQSSRPAEGARPSPGEMKAKLDSLIQGEVKNGTLTDDQANELKQVFAKAFSGGPHGAGGPGGPGGAGGPPPDAQASDSSSTDSTSATDEETSKLLTEFLDALKEAASRTSSYDSTGDSSATESKSLVVNYQA
jgi:hypothetical protein